MARVSVELLTSRLMGTADVSWSHPVTICMRVMLVIQMLQHDRISCACSHSSLKQFFKFPTISFIALHGLSCDLFFDNRIDRDFRCANTFEQF